MTPTDINAINRTLAEFMGWTVTADGHKASDPGFIFEDCGNLWLGSGCRFWSPATDRNDLAEVVARLTLEQWSEAERLTRAMRPLSDGETLDLYGPDRTRYFLTCDPAIVAKAVAEVVTGTPSP